MGFIVIRKRTVKGKLGFSPEKPPYRHPAVPISIQWWYKEKLIARGSSATAGELEEVKEVKEVRCHCEEALRADAAIPVE